MKVVLFGAQKIGVDVTRYLVQRTDIDLCGVISSDMNRDRAFSDCLLSEFCAKNDVSTISTEDVVKIKPDLILSIYYRKIISQEIISTAKMGAINLHPAPLPKYRGCVPTYWAIINGETFAGTTLHFMTGGIDDGRIIAQASISIGELTGADLHREAMRVGFDLVKYNFDDVMSGKNLGVEQNHAEATYFGPYRSCFRYINWNNTAESIIRHVKAHHTPFQGSTAWNKYCEILVNRCNVVHEKGWPCGKYEFDGKSILIQAQDHRILVSDWNVVGGELKTSGMFVSGIKGA